MKSITEFLSFKLAKGIDTRTALLAEGKTPEEVLASIGESFKLEGEKLQHFVNSLDVAAENMEKLSRILVVTYAEGESVNPKAVQVEESYYIPEFIKPAGSLGKKKSDQKDDKKGKGKGKGKSGPKSSPWGISPEELAAKKASSKKNQKAEK